MIKRIWGLVFSLKNWYSFAIFIMVSLAIAAVVGAKAFNNGVATGEHNMRKEVLKAEQEAKRAEREVRALHEELNALAVKFSSRLQQASADYQELKAKYDKDLKVQNAKVQKIVEKPVYSQPCMDINGLRELNHAIKAR